MFARSWLFPCLLLCSLQAAAAPEIRHWETGSGSRVYFVPLGELPMVDLQVSFDAGSARDPDGMAGLSMLTNGLLDEGAGGMDADGLSFEFERLGARYGASTNTDMASVSLRTLSDPEMLDPALANLRRVLGAPDFPGEALARRKQRMQVSIQRKQQSPGALADDAFQAALYGDHPYAAPKEGTQESVSGLERGDVRSFYRRYYTAANAVITLVGDLDRERAEAVAESLSQSLNKGRRPPALPEVEPLSEAETVRIDHPSAQTHILLGQPGVVRGDPDYFPLYVGNHILGGSGMVSRLFEEIRNERGLAYSTYSYFIPRRRPGPFTAGLQTRGDQAEQALEVLRESIRSFAREGPSAEELEAAKRNISGGFPLRIDSNSDIREYVAMIGFYGLPLDYLDTFIEKVEAVTVAEIRDAFRRRLDPDRMVTVMVGPPADGDAAE